MPSQSVRQEVAVRARGCCEYCCSQARFATESFSIEHIAPRSRLSCQGCNGHKYTKTHGIDPIGGEVVPLFHPRRQRWREHFIWSEDCTLIIGLTPTGRATIEALRLNRDPLINLRRLLYSVGEHPPPEDDG